MLFLAIDGGGTRTTCALADDCHVLATASAGGSNIVRVGEAKARANLHAAITQACKTAGGGPAHIEHTVIGVAGAAVPQVADAIRRILAEIVGGEITVVGDMVIALEAAFAGQPGVIVIAGTGSIAFGRNCAGQTARAGGWGYAISDEGSGHWIGRSAVTAALRAHDAACGEAFVSAILKAWELPDVEHLAKRSNASPPPDFAALFPAVLEAAKGGDLLANEILDSAGEQLAQVAAAVIGRLWAPKQSVRVALVGGVFRHSPEVRHSFYTGLRLLCPHAAVCFKIVDPISGALWLARQAAAALGTGK
jgi:N-acetylglucosamine kinase-like BadF-type ATPase